MNVSFARRVTQVGVALALCAAAATACRRGPKSDAPAASGAPTPTPLPTVKVPEGYHGLAWGTITATVQKVYPDLHPSKTNPKILVRETTANGLPATEAFFFDAKGGLEEVQLRFTPKRSPQEAAAQGMAMDKSMGPHDVPLADDNAYQYAWVGEGTEVRLTYDLRDSVAYGPVIAWAPAGSTPEPTPSATRTAGTVASGSPGACFVKEVRAARDSGMHLTGVEGGKGRLVLVFETAGSARELDLTADPKTTKLLGCATLPRAATGGTLKFRAETAIVESVGKSEPTALKFGGPAGLADLVTLQFKDGSWLSLRPGANDPLASQSGNAPK